MARRKSPSFIFAGWLYPSWNFLCAWVFVAIIGLVNGDISRVSINQEKVKVLCLGKIFTEASLNRWTHSKLYDVSIILDNLPNKFLWTNLW